MAGYNDSNLSAYSSIQDLIIIKTDENGEIQWSKVVGDSFMMETGSPFSVMPDGSYLIAGNKISPTSGSVDTPFYMKIDLAGNILMEGGFYNKDVRLGSPVLTTDGKLIATGNAIQPEGNYNNMLTVLAIYDPSDLTLINGIEWDYEPVDPVNSTQEAGLSVVELEGTGIMIYRWMSKYTGVGPGWQDSVVIDRLDLNGNLDTTIYLDETVFNSYNGRLMKTSDGNLVICYFNADGFLLRKITSAGTIVWENILPVSFGEDVYDVEILENDELIVAGMTSGGVMLIKLDAGGNVVWNKIIEKPGYGGFRLNLEPLPDQSFIISGAHRLQPGEDYQMFLLKTDDEGNYKAGRLEGVVIKDNGDCVFDIAEPPLKNWLVEAEGSNETYYGTTDSTGFYSILLDTGDYIVRFKYPNNVYWEACTSESSVSVENIGDTATLNMGVLPLLQCPLMDVNISSYFLRPCQKAYYTVKYSNYGTTIAQNAGIDLNLDDHLTLLSSSLPYSVLGDIIHFDLGDVQVGESGTIYLEVFLDCAALPGLEHCSYVNIFPPAYCGQGLPPSGITPADEDCRFNTSAFDPNDKTALPFGEGALLAIPNDTTITYLIRFQNTGTDTAFQVIIKDTLSHGLDISTFRPGPGSHDYEWEISDERILRFTFENILLPDSTTNEIASRGFVSFEIKPQTPLLPGTIIENTGYIYFDFNAPIKTNTVYRTIAKPVFYGVEHHAICFGETYNGIQILNDTFYVDTLQTAWYDSITEVSISVNPEYSIIEQVSICFGESYDFYGQTISQSGEYQAAFSTLDGCDSIVTLILEVFPLLHENEFAEICEGSSYQFDGQQITQAGVYEGVFIANNGCDSLVTLTLEVLSNSYENLVVEICEGSFYLFAGEELFETGVYDALFTNQNGCDSTVTLNLSVLSSLETNLNANICPGTTYFFEGQILSEPGEYIAELTSVNGCDSTVILSLELLPELTENLILEICEGEEFVFNGEVLTSPGEYQAILTASNGCDSTIHLQLVLNELLEEQLSASICEGEMLSFYGQLLSDPGIYTAYVENMGSCDSLITLDLSVLSHSSVQTTGNICEGEIYLFNGEELSVPGNYQAILTATNGCDSILNLQLLVQPVYETDTLIELQAGQTYNGIQIYTDTNIVESLIAANGCDSIVNVKIEMLTAGQEKIDVLNQLSLYPNPFSKGYWITFSLPEPGIVTITMMDLLGRRDQHILEDVALQPNSYTFKIAAENWPPGIYWVRFQINEHCVWRKIVKH